MHPSDSPTPERLDGGSKGLASTAAIVALIAAMLITTIAGVVYAGRLQQSQGIVRFEAREMRMTRQALMELDATVLRFLTLASEKADPVAYGRAVSKLESLGTDHLPRTIMRGPEATPAVEVLASLKSAWDEMVQEMEAGAGGSARATYGMRLVERDMNAFLKAFAETLDGYEQNYADIQTAIDVTIALCVAGQFLTGLICITAFLVAARRSVRESQARAVAVQSADATREQVQRLFEMTDILQSAADHTDANAVLRSTATELLPDFGGALYVFNNSRDRLTLSTHWGMSEEHLVDHIGLTQCWALKRGKPHINRPDSHKLCCEHHTSPDHALEIPMIARGEILGLMQFYASGVEAEARLEAIGSVGSALSDAMSLALANLGLRDKLRSQALRDPLTGLYNRRYMEDTLERVVRLAEREKSEVSLIMIDLDHFKRLNDNYGHSKGDAVLRDAAAVIISHLRESDVACRYGGEELLVILPQCGLDAASAKAERLRAAIEALSEPNGAQVSASFGVASIPKTSAAARDVLAAADAALYEAKQAGRNRVVNAPLLAADVAKDAEFLIGLRAAE
ncbi:GGDEF domain-containing protein [Methylopila sp. M107]|uniref:sensor domain-containing diguanylate cyclase n=1 Tax=Methylopila sp. M107 TaxID=1101190 RepID=UPI0003728D47|nr:GGDEF domain-containing protein [Methylopila sp. M107]